MFAPSLADVRRFFVEASSKRQGGQLLTPLETIAADWIDAHPEYAGDLADAGAELAAAGPAGASPAVAQESGATRENPFLHLSMHLSITEQIGIDQPRGIREACAQLVARRASPHEAQHEIMECLGRMLWDAQRNGRPPDGDAYVECVRAAGDALTPGTEVDRRREGSRAARRSRQPNPDSR